MSNKKFKAIPDKYRKGNIAIIDINDPEPIKKFKEWRSDYWNGENYTDIDPKKIDN